MDAESLKFCQKNCIDLNNSSINEITINMTERILPNYIHRNLFQKLEFDIQVEFLEK